MSNWTQHDYNAFLARNLPPLTSSSEGVEIESTLHDNILRECRDRGWIALHSRMDMATSRTVGEPDFVVLADEGRVLLVECKSRTGKLSPAQAALHAWARKLGHTVHVVRSMDEFRQLTSTPKANDSIHKGIR